MPRLIHTPATDGAFTYNGETWDMDNGIIEVGDEETAAEIVNSFTKVGYASEPEPPGYECGVNGCSRSVDDPEETCWQH